MQKTNYLLFALSAFIAAPVNAQSVPSHCFTNEFPVVDARMGRIDKAQSELEKHLVIARNGKVVSLCADKPHEPFGYLVYRYGPIGKVELERFASAENKFGIFSRSTSPHTGEDIVFFATGKLTYYITVATGQGSGVSLLVFDGNKNISNLFSGNDQGTDYALGPVEMNFESASSPIFKYKKPSHDF